MRVVIMSGISGSGKSTYIKNRFGNDTLAFICSADHYFLDSHGNYKFDVSKLSRAHGECLKQFSHYMRNFHRSEGVTIIVDNTNTTTEEIAPYYAFAAAYEAEIEHVTLHCGYEPAAKRNAHGVPLSACKAMADRLSRLRLPPFWSIISTSVLTSPSIG